MFGSVYHFVFGVTLIFIVEKIEWAWSKVLFSVDKWIMEDDEIKKEQVAHSDEVKASQKKSSKPLTKNT